ncbi:MAG: type II secretion system secretin GspD [Deltaproteobacteria bacterium]|nr:type II secretion system secretin GspD [Deltaproteobacteria bacterium]
MRRSFYRYNPAACPERPAACGFSAKEDGAGTSGVGMKCAPVVFFLTFLLVMLSSPSMAAKKAPASKAQPEKITINFVDVELSSLVRIMSEITGKNFIYDDSLKGKVTVIAPEKLTGEEALSLFVSSLELKNFTMVPAGDSYKIIPSSQAKQSGTRVLKDADKARADEYIVRLIPLNYVQAQEAFPAVQPLVSRNGQISVFGARNALLVVDTAQNIEKILKILNSVDAVTAKGEPEIVYIKNAQAEVIAQILRKEEQRRSGRRAQDQGAGAQEGNITADPRLNAVILSDALADKDFYKKFIALLDVAPPEASSRINVHYLENANAEDLGKVLDTLTRPAPPGGMPPGAQALQTLTQEFTGRIVVTPDKSTNSLIIMASPSDYNNLVQVIHKLDRRPRQVFVEAMITEVTVDKAIELGTKFRVTGKQGGKPVAIGGVGTVDVPAMQTILNGLAGLSIGGLSNFITVPVTRADGTTFNLTAPGFAALFSLSDFRDVVNVLSTPHILTSDNSDAEIMVGENVPFLSKLERESTTTAQPLLQSIERKDIGIRLKIKPKISEGDYVKLDIYQEISAIAPTTTTGASDLITTKRSAKTTVVVKNKQTVVIGGLIQDKSANDTTKVPLLGDIPFLGWLFKSSKDRNQKTNLLVFITPYIIEDFHALEDLKKKKEQEFDEKSRPGATDGKPGAKDGKPGE